MIGDHGCAARSAIANEPDTNEGEYTQILAMTWNIIPTTTGNSGMHFAIHAHDYDYNIIAYDLGDFDEETGF